MAGVPKADPTITAVAIPADDPNQRHVRVGRRIVARVTAAEAAALGLRVGASWDARRQARVEVKLARAALRRVALQRLARHPSTREELRTHLSKRGYDASEIRVILRELVGDGWVSGATSSPSEDPPVPARKRKTAGSGGVPSARRAAVVRVGTRAVGTSSSRTRRERP